MTCPLLGNASRGRQSPCRVSVIRRSVFAGTCTDDVFTSSLGSLRRSWCQTFCPWLFRCRSALSAQPPAAPWDCRAPQTPCALLMATAPVCKCREFQPGPTSSFCLSEERRGHSLASFPVRITGTNSGRQGSQGMSPRDSSCCFSEQSFVYSLKTLQEPG